MFSYTDSGIPIFYLNPKFQDANHLLYQHSLVYVGPGRKSRGPSAFSERGSNIRSFYFWQLLDSVTKYFECKMHSEVSAYMRCFHIKDSNVSLIEPRREKTNVLHTRKQRRRSADQRLCFRYSNSIFPLPSKSEISSLESSSVAARPGLCRTWVEIPKTGFLTTRLNYDTWWRQVKKCWHNLLIYEFYFLFKHCRETHSVYAIICVYVTGKIDNSDWTETRKISDAFYVS